MHSVVRIQNIHCVLCVPDRSNMASQNCKSHYKQIKKSRKISPSKEWHPKVCFLPTNTHMHTQCSAQQAAAMARRTATDPRQQQQRILQQIHVHNHEEYENSGSACPSSSSVGLSLNSTKEQGRCKLGLEGQGRQPKESSGIENVQGNHQGLLKVQTSVITSCITAALHCLAQGKAWIPSAWGKTRGYLI